MRFSRVPQYDLSTEVGRMSYLDTYIKSHAKRLRLPHSERLHVLAYVEVNIPTMNGVDVALLSENIKLWWLRQCSIHLLQQALLRRAEHLRKNNEVIWLKHMREWRKLERQA